MRTVILGLTAVVVIGAGAAVISGQHAPSSQHALRSHATAMHMCEADAGTEDKASNRHTAMLAEHLNLTAEQRATVERVAAEACAAMAQYHGQILAALTPEQREKLKALHKHGEADQEENALHMLMRKLHGR